MPVLWLVTVHVLPLTDSLPATVGLPTSPQIQPPLQLVPLLTDVPTMVAVVVDPVSCEVTAMPASTWPVIGSEVLEFATWLQCVPSLEVEAV